MDLASHPLLEVTGGTTATAFDLSQPTFSHHLKILRDTGVVESTRRGTWVYYRVVPETVSALTNVNGVSASPMP